uniref:Phospho-N-acetylmuramoyl-pentapeptide-transferase n=1 Tax=Pyramimonas obovata TaxID=1411642 RepID=A0A7S0RG57_9CHLO|mmetsp:Transcript_33552/g.73224  ORF Transcript_33552/g.73224 Transcript_33552/m.73224 type:complete len:476 (+) Transcript_33552:325-1752(+)
MQAVMAQAGSSGLASRSKPPLVAYRSAYRGMHAATNFYESSRRTARGGNNTLRSIIMKRTPFSFRYRGRAPRPTTVTRCFDSAEDSNSAPETPSSEPPQTSVPTERKTTGRLTAVILSITLGVAVFLLEIHHNLQSNHLLLLSYIGSLLASVVAGNFVLPLLRCLKAGQVVRLDGPPTHVLLKSGTPTMGGISFVPVGALMAVALTSAEPTVLAAAAATMGYAALGAVDDYGKMAARDNYGGVSPRGKLLAQAAIGGLFAAYVMRAAGPAAWSVLRLPGGWALPALSASLSYLLLWPLAAFTMTAESNAVNLTDGLDGLAAGTAAAAFVGVAAVVLQVSAHAPAPMAAFCCCMAGAAAGFLAHNHHRALMFMGDTGSLALGGALGAAAVAGGPSALAPCLAVTLLFAWEALSVMIQVVYFKYTKRKYGEGRRVFRMAPFHHHLELGGMVEVTIAKLFYAVAVGLAVLGAWLASTV